MKSPSIACIIRRDGSWPKLWDSALHLGSRHTIGLQNLSRLLVHHGNGLHPCPLCDEQGLSIPIIDHVISAHKRETGLNLDSVDWLLLLLVDGGIQFVYKFWKLYLYSVFFSFMSLLCVPGKAFFCPMSILYCECGILLQEKIFSAN